MPRTTSRGPKERTLYYGDCLEVMQAWGDACVDLVYLDPPFNSNADYSVLFGRKNGTPAQVAAFTDTWKWDAVASERVARIVGAAARPEHRVVSALESLLGPSGMLAYLSYMAERLAEVRRVLKPTGSVLLHCDPTASHYLKLIMDALFGAKQFRNEIVWKRTHSKKGSRKLGAVHDIVLFYGAGEMTKFNHVYSEHDENYIRKYYRLEDEHGRYQPVALTGPGIRHGISGKAWRGINPTKQRRNWGVPDAFPAHSPKPEGWDGWNSHQKLDHLDAVGLIHWPDKTGGMPRFKRYLSTSKGAVLTDVITDVPPLSAQAKERLGYPTQKPVALLERLVAMASNPGDLVLDPFCGCGTTVMAAQKLGRRWAGIDISSFACHLVRDERLKPLGVDAHIEGVPADVESAQTLCDASPRAFETWALQGIPGIAPNQRAGGDRGIDGRGLTHDRKLVLAQVAGGRSFSMSKLRDFIHVVEREKAAIGVYVTLRRNVSAGGRAEAARLGRTKVGGETYPRIMFWSVEERFERGGREGPKLPPMRDPYTGETKRQRELAL